MGTAVLYFPEVADVSLVATRETSIIRLRHLSLDARAARWPAALSLWSGRFFRFDAIASPDRVG